MLDNEFIMTDEILKSSSNFTQKFQEVFTFTSYNFVCSNIIQFPGRSLAFVLFYHLFTIPTSVGTALPIRIEKLH